MTRILTLVIVSNSPALADGCLVNTKREGGSFHTIY